MSNKTNEKPSLYLQLFEISQKIKKLEDEKAAIVAAVMDQMNKEKLEKFESPVGVISIVSKKSYEYSEKVKNLIDTVKDLKAFEEEKGFAQIEVKKSVRVSLR